MSVFLGIDPGATGALALISDTGEAQVVDWQGDERAMAAHLSLWLDLYGPPASVALERQQSMPKQGVASVFKLGANYGIWLGLLAAYGLPTILPRPCDWKKGYVPAKSDKDASLAVARRLFPTVPLGLKKHHGRAEALLLADFARREFEGKK
jgi:crossover junction endodeoxyribonuclease RuvC